MEYYLKFYSIYLKILHLLTESFKKRLKQLAGINENFGHDYDFVKPDNENNGYNDYWKKSTDTVQKAIEIWDEYMGSSKGYDISDKEKLLDIKNAMKNFEVTSLNHLANLLNKGEKTLNETSVPPLKSFSIKVKHDKGTKTIKTSASSEEAARTKVCNAEGCPESAIISSKEV